MRLLPKNTDIAVLSVLVVGLFSFPFDTARAQTPWSWPERAENLQQLPEDFPPQRLRAVMAGFTRALGVRCSHCHVGQEGAPLSSYDFASDDNPNKQTARVMLEMLGSVNEHLDKVETTGETPVNMWCHTCHAGRARPQRLGEAMQETYQAEGIEAAIELYRELRTKHYGGPGYDFREGTLNALGYGLLEGEKVDDAIRIFRLNLEFHPDSANAYDSLAEAYRTAGRIEMARTFYRKSLELDPGNENAEAMLTEMAPGTAP